MTDHPEEDRLVDYTDQGHEVWIVYVASPLLGRIPIVTIKRQTPDLTENPDE